MNDDQLREFFSSLSTLAQQGPIPVQAYSILVHNHSPDSLAEQLHQRWLSDSRFVPIAANIVLYVRRTNPNGLTLSSCVLALLLNDYRNRLELRNNSTLMFRNSVKALFEMYAVFVQIDSCVAKCLVKPMFESLDMLIENDSQSEDLETIGVILEHHGGTLVNLNSYLIDRLIVKIRSKICSDDRQMNGRIRRIFLHVYDLWVWGWNELMIPESLTFNYSNSKPVTKTSAPERRRVTQKKELGNKESIV